MPTCTACRENFETAQQQKEHFKLDWHRYNLKRKVVGLPAVTLLQFQTRKADGKAAAQKVDSTPSNVITTYKCLNCNKAFGNTKALENHKVTKKHILAVKKNNNVENITTKNTTLQTESPVEETKEATEKDSTELLKDEEEKEVIQEENVSLKIEDCMFCSHRAENLERYGFSYNLLLVLSAKF